MSLKSCLKVLNNLLVHTLHKTQVLRNFQALISFWTQDHLHLTEVSTNAQLKNLLEYLEFLSLNLALFLFQWFSVILMIQSFSHLQHLILHPHHFHLLAFAEFLGFQALNLQESSIALSLSILEDHSTYLLQFRSLCGIICISLLVSTLSIPHSLEFEVLLLPSWR